MTVSMDGLRLQAIRAYNGLIKELKRCEEEGGAIIVEKGDIEEYLDDLRMVIVTLACSSQDGEEGWNEIKNFTLDSLTSDEDEG